ncbi:MAG: transporter substrate-binding domain-containing protein [Proteobacteria bacterium]|nr:transporter substrate-binding domain-containing protein [Pseudomonadota bacterium]
MNKQGWLFSTGILLVLLLMPGMLIAGTVYDRVKETGTVRIGLLQDNAPLAFINEKNKWVGFEVDFADEVAKRIAQFMGKTLKVERVRVETITRIEYVKNKQIDMSIASITHTKEREKFVDFSNTYFFDGQSVLAKKGRYNTVKGIISKRMAVVQGTTNEQNLINLMTGFGIKNPRKQIVSFQDESFCFLALYQDKVAGWTADSTLLIGFAAKEPGKYELVGESFSVEPYGIGLPQNDIEWKTAVNLAIQDVWKDGTYKKIYDKWFGANTKYCLPMKGKIEPWP